MSTPAAHLLIDDLELTEQSAWFGDDPFKIWSFTLSIVVSELQYVYFFSLVEQSHNSTPFPLGRRNSQIVSDPATEGTDDDHDGALQ